MKRADWILALIALAGAVAGYLIVGSPGMADRPLSVRDAELATRNPSEMTQAEAAARLESLVQARPDDPQPHFFLGELRAGQGREEDAVRHYQSALRRDSQFVPAMVGLADAFVRMSEGRVSGDARRIYARAWQEEPGQVRAGFMLGLAEWQDGNREGAEDIWQQIENRLEENSAEARMFAGWVSAARRSEGVDE
ncbi:MAG: hypothetical protein GVY06_00585 [Alphaproteobacteria bacterium]|jgi:cytochrome c-type biogenesis protein CcmH|nr:hypothetical protein [Alphaproteobacteria bacterium]